MKYAAGFHVMAKPVGPMCNLACKYCFYLEKSNFFQANEQYQMSDSVLETYIAQYMAQDVPEISFVWQGGEPLLAGINFYKKAVTLQKKYSGGKKVHNSIQTNGTLLDETWLTFFKQNGFVVGISLDGPQFLHDRFRVDRRGQGTFYKVAEEIKHLNTWAIPYNVLISVSKDSCRHGKRIYRMLRSMGVTHMQFTPLIERLPDKHDCALGLHYHQPTALKSVSNHCQVTDFTVNPVAYADFLIDIFTEWIEKDVGKIFFHNVEDILPVWLGLPPVMCIYTQRCGNCMIIEHNGDIYSCDHFMYPDYRLGNIADKKLEDFAKSKQQKTFGAQKQEQLPMRCRLCEVLPVCGAMPST